MQNSGKQCHDTRISGNSSSTFFLLGQTVLLFHSKMITNWEDFLMPGDTQWDMKDGDVNRLSDLEHEERRKDTLSLNQIQLSSGNSIWFRGNMRRGFISMVSLPRRTLLRARLRLTTHTFWASMMLSSPQEIDFFREIWLMIWKG